MEFRILSKANKITLNTIHLILFHEYSSRYWGHHISADNLVVSVKERNSKYCFQYIVSEYHCKNFLWNDFLYTCILTHGVRLRTGRGATCSWRKFKGQRNHPFRCHSPTVFLIGTWLIYINQYMYQLFNRLTMDIPEFYLTADEAIQFNSFRFK